MTISPDCKRAHDKAATRAHLLSVAKKLFEVHGFEAMTMRYIASCAERSTGALFAHWKGKEELFSEAMGRPYLSDATGAALLEALREAAPAQAAAILKRWAA